MPATLLCDGVNSSIIASSFDLAVNVYDPHKEELIAQSEGQVF
jgi:hypothetical protein